MNETIMTGTDRTVRFFFLLLRSGLTGQACDGADTDGRADWEGVFRMARKQAVTALVWDGIQAMDSRVKPPQAVAHRFFAETLLTERAARRMEALLPRLLADVEGLGVPAAVLKGQAYAALYRTPLHRQPGDIDLFTGPGHDRVQRGLPTDYLRDRGPDYFHSELHRDGLLIENHRLTTEFAWPPYARRMRRMEREWFPKDLHRRQVGATDAPVPPPWFELVHAVVHFGHHLTESGVGLRQLCDWATLLRTHASAVGAADLTPRLRRLGLERMAGVMTRLAVDLLGLDTLNPLTAALLRNDRREQRLARMALADILTVGNFGHSEPVRRTAGMAAELRDLVVRRGTRSLRYAALWPAEVAAQPLVRCVRYAARCMHTDTRSEKKRVQRHTSD